MLRDHFAERPHSRVIAFVAYRTTVSALCAHLHADPAVTSPLHDCIHHDRAPTLPSSPPLSPALDLTLVPTSPSQLSGLVRAAPFVGRSSRADASGAGAAGMDQAAQQRVLVEFKAGTHNVLVATSVAEEGLDIGEVGVVLCLDPSPNPNPDPSPIPNPNRWTWSSASTPLARPSAPCSG